MNRYKSNSSAYTLTYLRDVLRVLVERDFKLRYKRSLFGVAWSLMVPLAQLLVFYLVFKRIVPLNIPHYTTFLFTGLLPWTWLQTSLMTSAMTVVDNRELVKQVGFPVGMLPPAAVTSQLIHFLLALPVLAGFLYADGYRGGIELAALPLVIVIQFAFILSMTYIFATLQVKFRDTQYLLGIALFLVFYLTPVFWDDSNIPEPYKSYMALNPVAMLLNAYRAILLRHEWPDSQALLTVSAFSVVLMAFGYLMFSLARNHFVEEL